MLEFGEIKLKPEYENDLWASAHKVSACYTACFEQNRNCAQCPFYDVFDTFCRNTVHCRTYLVNNAVAIHSRHLKNYCESYPERPVIPPSAHWEPCPDECEYFGLNACPASIGEPCAFGLYRGE